MSVTQCWGSLETWITEEVVPIQELVFGFYTFDMALRAPTSLLRSVNTPKTPL